MKQFQKECVLSRLILLEMYMDMNPSMSKLRWQLRMKGKNMISLGSGSPSKLLDGNSCDLLQQQ